MTAEAAPHPPAIDDLRWDRRIVLIFAPAATDPRLAGQRAAWTTLGRGAADRDLRLVEVVGDAVGGAADDAASLRRRYDIAPGAFAALLIGKDGHVALRDDAPLTADRLTHAIDAMPMRRREMDERRSPG